MRFAVTFAAVTFGAIVVVLLAAAAAACVAAIELPRHVEEQPKEAAIARALGGGATVVAAIVDNLAAPTESDALLLDAFARASMHFVQPDARFVALARHGVEAPMPKAVQVWITRESPLHDARGVRSGVFVLRKRALPATQAGEGDADGASAALWRDFMDEASGVDVPVGALTVDVAEVVPAAGDADAVAAHFAARLRCLVGPDVRELRTEADLAAFVLSPCAAARGLSIVVWPRAALWPYTQKVPRNRLAQLRATQHAAAALARVERGRVAFGWIDDDAPLLLNTSFLALANGNNAPVVAYLCDERCVAAAAPFDMKTPTIKFFGFKPFARLDGAPAEAMPRFVHIGLMQFFAEVAEVAAGPGTTAVIDQLGVTAAQLPASLTCDEPVLPGDAFLASVVGTAHSVDTAARTIRPTVFYRSSRLQRGEVFVAGEANPELPPQFGSQPRQVIGRLCLRPPSRAVVVIRAHRHYNESDSPPRVHAHSTLVFDVEVIARADDDAVAEFRLEAQLRGRRRQAPPPPTPPPPPSEAAIEAESPE
jgi:hypothetical protein